MKCQQRRVRLHRIGIISIAGVLMTAGFWMLNEFSLSVVRAQEGLGGPLPNLTSLENTMFSQGVVTFTKSWDAQQGLGPVFTQPRCSLCHGTPVNGGSTATKNVTLFGTIDGNGFNPLTNEGGMLLQPFSVSRFQPSCILQGERLPSDATIRTRRVPPPLFGLGLIDSIPEADIQANAVDKGMGIHGIANMVPDENGVVHVGRFGHQDQVVSLTQFTGQAMQHELGITNPVSPDEDLPQGQPIPPNCSIAVEPNDDGTQMIAIFHYALYLAPSAPGTPNPNGQALFNSIGCALCHVPSYTTGPQVSVRKTWDPPSFLLSKALSSKPVNLYSDLLLHDLGRSSGIPMGSATGSMFRTAPLWGLSVKVANAVPLLHDGKTTSVRQAIVLHATFPSEAAQVINNFKALSPSDQDDVIAFVSSL